LFLGEISFTMYLLHFLILGTFSSFLFLKLQTMMGYVQAVALTFVLSIPVIFAAAYVMYRYIDKNTMKLSQFIYEKTFGK